MESAKRRPPTVEPLTVGDVTVSVEYSGRQYGIEQTSGVLTATSKAGTHLWTKAVYPVVYDEAGEEADAQDVFITSIAAGPDAGSIIATNEDGQRFSVALSDGTVTALE
jgi:hypothetical protein